MGSSLRRLPAVGAVLSRPELILLLEQVPRELVVRAVQQAVAEARARLAAARDERAGDPAASRDGDADSDLLAGVAARAVALALRDASDSLRRVINATGIVLHTNLGRAVLPEEAVSAVTRAARGYSTLEYNLAAGRRGSRHDHLRELVKLVSGAEDGFAVNNNAGAVLLMLNTLAEGREVIVSRGELVEIGGSFRIPDIMRKSGATLVEVGTTNRTHPDDYRRAVSGRTALILKVHTSNYKIVGFAAEVPPAQLAAIGRDAGVPLLYDLGSGAIYDYGLDGLGGEPTLKEAVGTGAAVVTASGDKLLGGPQAGVVAGRADLLAEARRNPLARALRLDKLTIAALEATLRLYLRHAGDRRALAARLPVVGMITRTAAELRPAAEKLAAGVEAAAGRWCEVRLIEGASGAGGGAFPARDLPTWLVGVRHRALGAGRLAACLRTAATPVIARVEQDELLFDPRTLLPGEAELVAEALAAACLTEQGPGAPEEGDITPPEKDIAPLEEDTTPPEEVDSCA